MIFSKEHGYIYFEVPHTASATTWRELQDMYDGDPGVRRLRHLGFGLAEKQLGVEFVESAFTFCTMRNPLDIAVTQYEKIRTNYKSALTNPKKWNRNGGSIGDWRLIAFGYVQAGASYGDFLEQFASDVVESMLPWRHVFKRSDFVMRYERLHEDFPEAIRHIGLEPKRPLPRMNVTTGKRHFTEYYDAHALAVAREAFEPLQDFIDFDWPEPHEAGPDSENPSAVVLPMRPKQAERP